jgi:hypothetical protein
MSAVSERPLTVDELLETTHPHCHGGGELLDIRDEPGLDVYNTSGPFKYDGRMILAGRSEKRSEINSTTKFYKLDRLYNSWTVDNALPQFQLEDPFYTKIHGEFIIGGVKVYKNLNDPDPKNFESFETWLYRGKSLEKLTHFAVAENMKDVRIAANNGHIDVLTRPKGVNDGPGKIGYTSVKSLDDLKNPRVFKEAPIVENLFAHEAEEWGGGNDILGYTRDGWLKILGHIARYKGFDPNSGERNRKYYPFTGEIHPKKLMARNVGIIACRNDFPEAPSKEAYLEDVVFSSKLVVTGIKTVFYGGLSDAAAGRIQLTNTKRGI